MEEIPYALIIVCVMYAQICTKLDINFIDGMLGKYQSNPCFDHWKIVKKVLRYL